MNKHYKINKKHIGICIIVAIILAIIIGIFLGIVKNNQINISAK